MMDLDKKDMNPVEIYERDKVIRNVLDLAIRKEIKNLETRLFTESMQNEES